MSWKPDRRQLIAGLLAIMLAGLANSAIRLAAPMAFSGWLSAFASAVLLVGLYATFVRLMRRQREHS